MDFDFILCVLLYYIVNHWLCIYMLVCLLLREPTSMLNFSSFSLPAMLTLVVVISLIINQTSKLIVLCNRLMTEIYQLTGFTFHSLRVVSIRAEHRRIRDADLDTRGSKSLLDKYMVVRSMVVQ